MSFNNAEVLTALAHITDPAARELCRREVNRLAFMPKVSARMLAIPSDVFSARHDKLVESAPICKSGPRKGWPKNGLDKDAIAGITERAPEAPKPGPKKPRRRTKTAVAVAQQIPDSMVWDDNDLLVPAV